MSGNGRKAGRPEKKKFSRLRIHLWAQVVRNRAGVGAFRDLEGRLGDDGKWDGLWSRYSRGLIGPSRKRVARIEEKVSGTERYFSTCLWDLIEDRVYLWQDLFDAVVTIPPDLFPQLRREGTFGRLVNPSDFETVLQRAVDLVSDDLEGIHGLATILLLIREAELARDEPLYIHALTAWAKASERKRSHPILEQISLARFAQVARPLERIQFSDEAMNACWQQYLSDYIDDWHDGVKPRSEEFDVLDCISRFEGLKVRPKIEAEYLVIKHKVNSRADDSVAPPFWALPTRISG